MAFQFNGQQIYAGKSFVDADGNQYPTNWTTVLSQEQKDELGIVWVADPEPVDKRFYWSENNAKPLEDYNATDKNDDPILDEDGNQVVNKGLKSQWVAKQKEIAGSLLSPTDWYVTRKAEDSTAAIPDAVATYRAAVRTVSGQREAQITAAETLDAFIALVTNQPTVRNDAGETVANTKPFLTPWPEQ